MELRHLLAAFGVGNTSALLFVVGGRAVARGATGELTVQLIVSRVLPLGVVAAIAILVGSRYLLETAGRRILPAAGALAAPGYAVPAVVAVRTATGSVVPPPSPAEVAIVGVVSASALYVIAWFAGGPRGS